MNKKADYIKWVIVSAPLGVFLGFLYAPPDFLSQLMSMFLGAVLFTGVASVLFWVKGKKGGN